MINLNRSVSIWIVLSLFLSLFLSQAEVITLTPETFSDKVKEKDTAWFVKFCVPWCKHCKNLGTLWEEVGKAMEGEDEIEVGEVDCGASKSVCSKADIHSYPTFKLFFDGEEVAKYQGPRDVESLKAFVLDEAEKAAAKAQLGYDKDLQISFSIFPSVCHSDLSRDVVDIPIGAVEPHNGINLILQTPQFRLPCAL
uniref:Thioredoxin family protein n=3 Tax=Populus TaxID=3689 RepID=A0A4U5PLC6_POPAL|nr:thioredoxin family protein [Populus alba]